MKFYIYALNILFIVFFIVDFSFSRQLTWKEISPTGYLKQVLVADNKKDRKSYFLFNISKNINFTITGPTIIKIYLRKIIQKKNINVKCLLVSNNKIIKKINVGSIIDKKYHLTNSKNALSKLQVIEINAKSGKQNYVLKTITAGEAVLVYIKFQQAIGKEKKYVYMTPNEYQNALVVKQKNVEATYYKSTPSNAILFSNFIGPAEITILSRAIIMPKGVSSKQSSSQQKNKNNKNKTKQLVKINNYTFTIFSNGKKIKDCKFNIKEDKEAKIINNSKNKFKLGKIKTYNFKVPAGLFNIKIKPLQKEIPLIFRMKIPKKYVKNTLPTK